MKLYIPTIALFLAAAAGASDVIQPQVAMKMPTQYNASCLVLDARSDYNKLFMVAKGATADLYAKNKSMFGVNVVYYGVDLFADESQYAIKGTLGTLGQPIDIDAKVARKSSSRINVLGYEFDCTAD